MDDKKKKIKTIDLIYIALCTVLICLCSWLSIPAAVPFTMQTFGVFCTIELLGARRGTVSILVYLALGAAGVPVFSGFQGGFGRILGTTGGYMIGFIIIGVVCRLSELLFGKQLGVRAAAMLLGLAACYAFGTAWFIFLYAKNTGPIALGTALGWCVLPFIIPDIIKLSLAIIVAGRVKKLARISQ